MKMHIINAVVTGVLVVATVHGQQFSDYSYSVAREDDQASTRSADPYDGTDTMSRVDQSGEDFRSSVIRAGLSLFDDEAFADSPAASETVPDKSNSSPALDAPQLGLSRNLRPVIKSNGSPARKSEYPYSVSLRKRSGGAHFCGGALIGPSHVLTAAHCVDDSGNGDSRPDVVIGAVFAHQLDGEGVEVFSTKKVVLHPDFTARTRYPDLAILELDGESATAPVGLPHSEDHSPQPGDELTSMGWGRTSSSSGTSAIVQVVRVKYIGNRVCSRRVRRPIRLDQMCSGGEGAGSCVGAVQAPRKIALESIRTAPAHQVRALDDLHASEIESGVFEDTGGVFGG
ncbi:hypothetical protein BSKO_06231 [Bryopsis sp. KO-2023]|nr:hypothetical protein BSKO_06231 [Bryopsis sp. KO-2023]